MKLATRRDGDMYLPVDTYRRGRQEIVLIGMIHIAPAAFYDRVRELLDAYIECDYRILAEGISRFEGDDFGLREFDRRLLAAFDKMRDRSRLFGSVIANATGMVTQLDAFPDWRQWECGDLSALERMRLQGLREVPPVTAETVEAMREKLGEPEGARAAYRLFQLLPTVMGALWPVNAVLGSVVLHHRNRFAILKALEAPVSAVLPWGAAHLPGMGKLLERNGFERESRAWLLALPKWGSS